MGTTRYYSIHLCVGDRSTIWYLVSSSIQFDLKACDESPYTMTIYLQNSSWSIFISSIFKFMSRQSESTLLFSPKTVHEQCSTWDGVAWSQSCWFDNLAIFPLTSYSGHRWVCRSHITSVLLMPFAGRCLLSGLWLDAPSLQISKHFQVRIFGFNHLGHTYAAMRYLTNGFLAYHDRSSVQDRDSYRHNQLQDAEIPHHLVWVHC